MNSDQNILQEDRLSVSQNRRYIVRNDGTPFFWLGNTAWELLHRFDRSETERYLNNRVEKGFTVIQTVVLAELDGLNTPNSSGEIPLENLDPTKPREEYFEHVDWVIAKAKELGLYIALLPTWGDKVSLRYAWAKGPEIFTKENASIYGKFLGNRYKKSENIIWVLGGDRDADERALEIWRSMAFGIIEGVGSKDKCLMTFHPQPFENGSSSRWFHHDDWLDFNMLQTGHDKQRNTFDQIAAEYALTPTKPVIDGEPTYEAHGLSSSHLKMDILPIMKLGSMPTGLYLLVLLDRPTVAIVFGNFIQPDVRELIFRYIIGKMH